MVYRSTVVQVVVIVVVSNIQRIGCQPEKNRGLHGFKTAVHNNRG